MEFIVPKSRIRRLNAKIQGIQKKLLVPSAVPDQPLHDMQASKIGFARRFIILPRLSFLLRAGVTVVGQSEGSIRSDPLLLHSRTALNGVVLVVDREEFFSKQSHLHDHGR